MYTHERFKDFNKSHCWQHEIRRLNIAKDMLEAGLDLQAVKSLRIPDFDFEFVPKTDKERCRNIKQFIERHEWLGKMPIWVTHRFVAKLKSTGQLAGVIIMATPNSFSHLLGKENKDLEKLISRGACISWSPKNLGSWLIMKSIHWMVQNTSFRSFTAYSDPEAKELGTIYQACNFYYLGQQFGSGNQYLDPDNLNRGWFGDSGFADRSMIVRYAKKLGIEWQKEWYRMVGKKKNIRKVNWNIIPEEIAKQLKQERARHKLRCQKRPATAKHKYTYILGRTKKETKELRKLFTKLNPNKANLLYPHKRGE